MNNLSPRPLVSRLDRFFGCLLGGAIGDALGAPIEFMTLREIRKTYGTNGISGFVPGFEPSGSITDDTQLSLFTAEGLLCAAPFLQKEPAVAVPRIIWHAYQRWLDTQDETVPWDKLYPGESQGWLQTVSKLRHRRAPGNTCLSGLSSGLLSSPQNPQNSSKGCGGIMRIAPIGLIADDPFELGCSAAAFTHTHPTGYLAAGAFALTVRSLLDGDSLEKAINRSLEELSAYPQKNETVEAIQKALALANSGKPPTPETVESLGGGWVADEALSISLYCALVATDYMEGVLLAVNHGGDSDSTGSLTGNLLGVSGGINALPSQLLENLEAKEIIERICSQLYLSFPDSIFNSKNINSPEIHFL